MLLHVVATTLAVDDTMHTTAGFDLRRLLQKVQDLPIEFFHLRYPHALPVRFDPSRIEYLATTGRIKRRLIQDDCRPRRTSDFRHQGVKLVQKRIVIVKMLSHK